jgi:sugar (pentulose or hexulose) kinase
MSQADYILAIDHGTQSVRALLFDLQGNLAAKARVVIEPYYSTQPGWAEQRPEYFWDSLCQACQQLWASTTIPKTAVRGVTLTTQRATVICVDKNGRPLRPAILWLDQRLSKNIGPVGGSWGLLFKLLRVEADVLRFRQESEATWLSLNEPQVWSQTHKFLLLSGYLTYRLCGRFVDAVGNQVGYLPLNAKKQAWPASFDWRWRLSPLTQAMLPELVAGATLMGHVSPAAAEATGIPVGLPLLAAAADKACEVLGAGSFEPNVACLSYGTAATLNTTQRKYLEVTPGLPPYPAALPGAYNPEVIVNRGFWMVSWFKKEFAHYEQALAAEQGVEVEELFDELVTQVPPGSLGLILQPYWMGGFKVLGPEAKGAIIGFGEVHTRAHLYRAILEGLAYALREGKEKTEQRSGVNITELRVAGGGARSNAALQLTADVFGIPALRTHTYETSALGAAMMAAVGLKLHPDFASAVKAMSHIKDSFSPNPEAHATYDQLYERVYKPLYTRLQPLYAEIQKITGYP